MLTAGVMRRRHTAGKMLTSYSFLKKSVLEKFVKTWEDLTFVYSWENQQDQCKDNSRHTIWDTVWALQQQEYYGQDV